MRCHHVSSSHSHLAPFLAFGLQEEEDDDDDGEEGEVRVPGECTAHCTLPQLFLLCLACGTRADINPQQPSRHQPTLPLLQGEEGGEGQAPGGGGGAAGDDGDDDEEGDDDDDDGGEEEEYEEVRPCCCADLGMRGRWLRGDGE